MTDREKAETGFELCANGEPCMGKKYLECPFSPRNNAEQNCGATMARNALALLKEQEDLGTELTNAVELIHKKNERIEKLLKEMGIVVRCKDCKHGEKSPTFKYYPDVTWCNEYSTSHNDDWFCADGERRS